MEFFLCYHHDDKVLAGKVKQEIERRGSRAFLAHEDIEVSKPWRDEILSHLKSCDGLITIVTVSFPGSTYAHQEVGMIMGRGKPVISLIFGGSLPGFLESFQAIHTSEANIGMAVERAIKVIKGRTMQRSVESESVKGRVSFETPASSIVDDTPFLKAKGEISFNVTFKKDSAYLIEVNSDEPVSVELISATEWIRKSENPKYRYTVERSRDYVKNANISFEPRRSGDWVIYIRNETRIEQQVGVRVTEET